MRKFIKLKNGGNPNGVLHSIDKIGAFGVLQFHKNTNSYKEGVYFFGIYDMSDRIIHTVAIEVKYDGWRTRTDDEIMNQIKGLESLFELFRTKFISRAIKEINDDTTNIIKINELTEWAFESTKHANSGGFYGEGGLKYSIVSHNLSKNYF